MRATCPLHAKGIAQELLTKSSAEVRIKLCCEKTIQVLLGAHKIDRTLIDWQGGASPQKRARSLWEKQPPSPAKVLLESGRVEQNWFKQPDPGPLSREANRRFFKRSWFEHKGLA